MTRSAGEGERGAWEKTDCNGVADDDDLAREKLWRMDEKLREPDVDTGVC